MRKLLLASLVTFFAISANADVTQNQQVYAAANVIKSFACANNLSIPASYVKNAKAVAILTDVKRAGAILTTQYGDGVFSAKDEYGNWSAPIFLKYRGFGVGPQVGYESSDIVVLFQTTKSYQDLFTGLETLEINAGAALGDGGVRGGRATDIPDVSAWMVSPGEVTGIYLGASVDLGKISIDDQATNDYYERIYDYQDILNDSPKASKYTRMFKGTLAKYLGDVRYYYECKNCKDKSRKANQKNLKTTNNNKVVVK